MTKSKMACIAVLLVLAALLCAGVQAAVAAEQTLTMSVGEMGILGTDPTLDNTKSTDDSGWKYGCWQWYHLFTHGSPLITYDDRGKIIPWLAESYEVSDDKKIVTFHLRKGVKFADGTPFNASVAKFNVDRMLTYGYADLRKAFDEIMNYDYSEATDEYTLKVHFTKGWLNVARPFAECRMYGGLISPNDVDPAWDIKGVLKSEKMYNGLGPYYVDENESISKEKVVLKRRTCWRDDLDFHKPKLDKIVLVLIKDPQTALLALEKGEIDYIYKYYTPPLDSLPALKENPKISIKEVPLPRMYFISTAWWKEPFNGTDGILLRKAICYALNREEMVEGAFNGFAMPATDSMGLSPNLRSDVPQCCGKGYEYDLDKAKSLLSEAGWNDTDGDGILDKNGKALKNLDFVISTSPSLSWQMDLAVVVQSQLKKIGIDVQIRALESAAYSDANLKTGDFDLLMTYNMGANVASAWELSGFNRKSKGYNISYYSNQNGTLESIVTAAQEASTEEERDRYLCQACNIIYEDAGIVPLVYRVDYAVMNSKVKGYEFGETTRAGRLEECWIED